MMRSLDPRVRLILGSLTLVLVLGSAGIRLLGAELLVLVLAAALSGQLEMWLKSMKVSGPMVGMVFAVGLAAFPTDQALEMALRFQALLMASFILFHSLTPQELGGALRRMGVPWVFSFILVTAMRYVPLMGQRLRAITDAQRSRGIDLRPTAGNLKNLAALMVPLLVQCFQLAEDLAVAMEARGFGRSGRTLRGNWRIPPWQYAVVAFWAAVVALVVFSWVR